MATTVKQLMSGDPISIAAGASALEAYETMLRHGIRHLPVLSADRRVVGVVTADDLAAALALPLRPRRSLSPSERDEALAWDVGEVMTHAPQTLTCDASVAEAAERMAEGRFGCLPIVDEDGHLEGLLSETDLLHALASSFEIAGARTGPQPDARAVLVDELERERAAIARRLERYHAVERELTADTAERPMDLPERSAEASEVNLTESLDALAARRLAALDHALDRAARGRLFVCEGCARPISLPRLRALPGTTRCIDCARAAEAGLAETR